jgi:hypothetical protein
MAFEHALSRHLHRFVLIFFLLGSLALIEPRVLYSFCDLVWILTRTLPNLDNGWISSFVANDHWLLG